MQDLRKLLKKRNYFKINIFKIFKKIRKLLINNLILIIIKINPLKL